MLGTGTQLDPYQITTVSQFRSMNDSTAYFKLMNDLDVNDTQWASGWTSVTLRFKEFDGDGHEIRNINYNGTGDVIIIGSIGTIRRFALNNFVSIGSDACFECAASGTLYFYECDFELDVLTRYLVNGADSSTRVSFDRCSFTLAGNITDAFNRIRQASKITNCQFNLVDFKLPNAISGYDLNGFINLNATRVSILGKAIKSGAGTVQWFNSASQCFVAVDMIGSAYRPTALTYNTPTTSCFYDKDLMGETLTAQTNVHALTTAQCKDKDYLNSIGFVVV